VKRLLAIALCLICLALPVTVACATGDSSAPTGSIEITDQAGRVVTLDAIPQRIVSLAPSNTEILFALGLNDSIVGVTDWCDYPPEALEKDSIGDFYPPNIEAIVAMEPDLAVAANIHKDEYVPQMESLGLKVIVLDPKTVDEVIDAIAIAGEATGTEDAASQLAEDMQARIDDVQSLVSGLSEEEIPRVFYVIWHDPLMTVGNDTLQDEVIQLAGGQNIFDDLSGYPVVDLETILDRDPQVIIVGSGHDVEQDATFQWVQNEARLRDTEAAREGMIFKIDADLVDRPGPRIVDGIEEMLELIHPELAGESQ